MKNLKIFRSPVGLYGRAEKILLLRDRGACAEAELCLVLWLTLKRGVDWDRNLLHRSRLKGRDKKIFYNLIK